MGRFEHKPKRIVLLCRTPQGKVALIALQAVPWSVLAVILSLVGSRRDYLVSVPRAWSSQCGDTGPNPFPEHQAAREARNTLATPRTEGPSQEQNWGHGWSYGWESWIASGTHQE